VARDDGAPLSSVFGRPSPAADRPGRLRSVADAGAAAYRADGGDGPRLCLRAASIAGVRHRLAGEGSDDAYAWRWTPAAPGGPEESWLVVAVADGVGTVPGSALAAAAAVSAACDVAAGALVRGDAGPSDVGDDRWWDPVIRQAAEAVMDAGGATTIVVAVIDPTGAGAVARVGDSTALLLVDGRWLHLWAAEIDDGALSTATAALPASMAVEVAGVAVPPGAALILLTDGVANPLHDGPTTVAPALASALATPPRPLELAGVADFSRQGCFDDRTILGVWVKPALSDRGPI
jgi:serine/threonine protein phosphatase PrpC